MSPASIIDLILTMALFAHVFYCFAWSRQNLSLIYKVLLLPQRNYIATKAWNGCLIMLVSMLVIYALLLWRFYMLLGALNAWGSSAIVLIVLTTLVAFYRLWHKIYFERLINEANALGHST